MLVQYEGIIYQCISEHTSSSFYSDIGYWKPISETGGSRFVISIPPESGTFSAGDVLTYNLTEGYSGAISTDLVNPPVAVVVKQLDSSVYLVATNGIVEFDSDIFPSPGSIYYLSATIPGQVTTLKPSNAKPVYIAVTSNKAVVLLGHYRLGTHIELETFVVTELDENEFQLRFTPENENFVFVAINGMLQQPNVYTISETGLLTIVLDEGEHLYPGDVITVRYFYGDEFTTVTLQMSGYTVGNDAGNVPLSNSARNVSLNADLPDNYHARNESGSIPISNGVVNVALNADMLDGAHLSTDTALLPGTDEYIPTQNAVRNAIETSIATFYHTYNAVDTSFTVSSGDVIASGVVVFYLPSIPSSENEAFVYVNGILAHPDDYTIDGEYLTVSGSVAVPGDEVVVKVIRPYAVFNKFHLDDHMVTAYHDGENGYIVNSSGDLYIDTVHPTLGIEGGCIRSHGKIYNAVWNDYADYWDIAYETEVTPGLCYADYGFGLVKPKRRADPRVIGICTDTFGYGMGDRPGRAPIAVSGFVLAYVDKKYLPGTLLTNREDGMLTKARIIDILFHRVYAKYVRPEPEKMFNNTIAVNGRHWVKVV